MENTSSPIEKMEPLLDEYPAYDFHRAPEYHLLQFTRDEHAKADRGEPAEGFFFGEDEELHTMREAFETAARRFWTDIVRGSNGPSVYRSGMQLASFVMRLGPMILRRWYRDELYIHDKLGFARLRRRQGMKE